MGPNWTTWALYSEKKKEVATNRTFNTSGTFVVFPQFRDQKTQSSNGIFFQVNFFDPERTREAKDKLVPQTEKKNQIFTFLIRLLKKI